MFESISSLLFYTNDLEKTGEFYKTLGFEVKHEEGKVSFRVNLG
jgi:hypothetical protein